MDLSYAFIWNYIMINKLFKAGDKVTCSKFYYSDRTYLSGKIGVFKKYMETAGGKIVALVAYKECTVVFCKLSHTKRVGQLLFEFMYE